MLMVSVACEVDAKLTNKTTTTPDGFRTRTYPSSSGRLDFIFLV
jgi:hypothetical protein